MSRIGKIPVVVPQGVAVTLADNVVTVQGANEVLSYTIPAGIGITIEDGRVVVAPKDPKRKDLRALFGLTRAQLANMVKGVSTGFEKKLELSGVGYRAQTTGTLLTLSVGFSHPVKIDAPQGVTFAVVEGSIIVKGADKMLVGNTAAKIRGVRPPEPYKGKGISYAGEKIRRKAGKAAKAVGAK